MVFNVHVQSADRLLSNLPCKVSEGSLDYVERLRQPLGMGPQLQCTLTSFKSDKGVI